MKAALIVTVFVLVACSKDKDNHVPAEPVQTDESVSAVPPTETNEHTAPEAPAAGITLQSPYVDLLTIPQREEKPVSELPCLRMIQEILPGTSANLECLKDGEAEAFAILCSSNGRDKTIQLERYLEYEAVFKAARKEADDFHTANPYRELPGHLIMELNSADTEWMIFGFRSDVRNAMEAIRRRSVDCPG